MRSQTDEQLAARWDVRPASEWPYVPRAECIPSRYFALLGPRGGHWREWRGFAGDWDAAIGLAEAANPGWDVHTCGVVSRSPVNPILVMFRKSVADGDDDAFENAWSCAKGWPMHGHVTDEDRAFALKMLTRLAALA
jgi:hypothetical protein